MATDRIRELAHAILSECAVWYLLPPGETPEAKEQRVVSTLDVAEAMLRAALADKTLIDGELAASRAQYTAEVDKGITQGTDLATARQNEIWGFYENEAPIYTTREEAHELSQLMTVEEANGLVIKLMAARQDSKELRVKLAWYESHNTSRSYDEVAADLLKRQSDAAQAQREKAK